MRVIILKGKVLGHESELKARFKIALVIESSKSNLKNFKISENKQKAAFNPIKVVMNNAVKTLTLEKKTNL